MKLEVLCGKCLKVVIAERNSFWKWYTCPKCDSVIAKEIIENGNNKS